MYVSNPNYNGFVVDADCVYQCELGVNVHVSTCEAKRMLSCLFLILCVSFRDRLSLSLKPAVSIRLANQWTPKICPSVSRAIVTRTVMLSFRRGAKNLNVGLLSLTSVLTRWAISSDSKVLVFFFLLKSGFLECKTMNYPFVSRVLQFLGNQHRPE